MFGFLSFLDLDPNVDPLIKVQGERTPKTNKPIGWEFKFSTKGVYIKVRFQSMKMGSGANVASLSANSRQFLPKKL